MLKFESDLRYGIRSERSVAISYPITFISIVAYVYFAYSVVRLPMLTLLYNCSVFPSVSQLLTDISWKLILT